MFLFSEILIFVAAFVLSAAAATPLCAQAAGDALVGHWRKTTIGYTGPRDDHLLLYPDGNAEHWSATAYQRSAVSNGTWTVDGNVLLLTLGAEQINNPYTFFEGKLVFPNIQNQRGFWEKIGD
ncbi:MAG: hypothetical protein ACR65U_12870 [Methylocystis sp.]